MRVPELLFLYLLVGACVALATYRRTGAVHLWAGPLWPLWLPSLLTAPNERYDTAPAPRAPRAEHPAVARLGEVIGAWAPELADTVVALHHGLHDLQLRLAALEAEVERPEHDLATLRAAARAHGRHREVHQRRLRNVEALVGLRDHLAEELASSLAHVEELASRVQLARFQGHTVDGVGHQLAQLVAAIEGTREVEQVAGSTTPTTLPA